MYLKVTQEDIDASRQLRTNSTLDRQRSTYRPVRDCPIGVAAKRQFGVDRNDILVYSELVAGDTIFNLPKTALAFMHEWDIYGRATPRTFRVIETQHLTMPDEYLNRQLKD